MSQPTYFEARYLGENLGYKAFSKTLNVPSVLLILIGVAVIVGFYVAIDANGLILVSLLPAVTIIFIGVNNLYDISVHHVTREQLQSSGFDTARMP